MIRNVRDAGDADIAAARLLLTANGWSGDRMGAATFTALLAQSRQALIAIDGAQVVGFARAVGDGFSNGYLSMLVVDARFRRRGIGRLLVERLLGDNGDMTWVLRARTGTEAFYEKLGFRRSTVAMERVRTTPASARESDRKADRDADRESFAADLAAASMPTGPMVVGIAPDNGRVGRGADAASASGAD